MYVKKRNFIIWSFEDGAIRVEKTNTLSKTYTHRCEGALREPVAIPNEIGFANSIRKPKGLENGIVSSLRSSQ